MEVCHISPLKDFIDIKYLLNFLYGNKKINLITKDKIYVITLGRPNNYEPFQFYIFNQVEYLTNTDILLINILFSIIKSDIKTNKFYTDPHDVKR